MHKYHCCCKFLHITGYILHVPALLLSPHFGCFRSVQILKWIMINPEASNLGPISNHFPWYSVTNAILRKLKNKFKTCQSLNQFPVTNNLLSNSNSHEQNLDCIASFTAFQNVCTYAEVIWRNLFCVIHFWKILLVPLFLTFGPLVTLKG